jgi:UrcA family protein
VAYDSTELASNNGQVELYEKLQNASHKICSSTSIQFTESLHQSAAYAKCFEGTLTAAVERLDQPGVSALHLTK